MIWPQSRCRGILPAAPKDGCPCLIVTYLLTTQTIDGYFCMGCRLLRVGSRLNDNWLLLAVLVTDYVTEDSADKGAADAVEHLVTIVVTSPTVASVASSTAVASSGP